jgi:DNA-binding CsgD family transcriptional regulator
VGSIPELERGRSSCLGHAWQDAYDSLLAADQEESLAAADLEMLATAAYMLGHQDEYYAVMERAHHGYLNSGEILPAARCAIWIGIHLAATGGMAKASGWLGRAQRLVDRDPADCVERGYLLLPLAIRHEVDGDLKTAGSVAAEAVAIAERFEDRDLFALAAHEQGTVLVLDGQGKEGLELLDEAMVAATAGELSPIATGIVYCGVILACQKAYELRRAQEWTTALTNWCDQQPDLVAFTGRCLVHRAEILYVRGLWSDALEEARRAAERSIEAKNPASAGEAAYLQGDVRRLRGEAGEAESSYQEAARLGREPQPGLALLRLQQGERDVAAAAIRRALGETADPLERAGLLPAYVEIMLALDEVEQADRGARELIETAEQLGCEVLEAAGAHALGILRLAGGDAEGALGPLRRAFGLWQEIEAPHEGARARVLIGRACAALGDRDAATLELEAARDTFSELGAEPELRHLDSVVSGPGTRNRHGLTDRELEVLRHLAAGATNRAIAAELVLSVRTVDRHVSNIFAKLGVSSRAAASAYAHRHGLT